MRPRCNDDEIAAGRHRINAPCTARISLHERARCRSSRSHAPCPAPGDRCAALRTGGAGGARLEQNRQHHRAPPASCCGERHASAFHPAESPDSSNSQSLLQSLLGVKLPPSDDALKSSPAAAETNRGHCCCWCCLNARQKPAPTKMQQILKVIRRRKEGQGAAEGDE